LNIIRQISFVGILAMGMTMVLTCGDIDLSVGAVYYMSAVAMSACLVAGAPIWLAITVGMLLGLGSGALNGFLVTQIGLPSFIGTLGTTNIIRGAALVATNGFAIALNSNTVRDPGLETFKWAASGQAFDFIPMMAIFLAIIAVIAFIIYHKTLLGFHFRAVGSSSDAAIAAGINTKSVRMTAFIICGPLASFGGIMMAAFLTNIQASIGSGMELSVIAPCIIGGTSISGGKGSIVGTIVGCLIVGVLSNGLILLGVSSWWQVVIQGIIIVGAVAFDLMTQKGKGSLKAV